MNASGKNDDAEILSTNRTSIKVWEIGNEASVSLTVDPDFGYFLMQSSILLLVR